MAESLAEVSHYDRCNAYLEARTGTYDFRCQRYDSVIEKLLELGFQDGDLVVDVGAGRCEFDHRMHERGLRPRYLPVDGSIDGVDLENWLARGVRPEFMVAIELLEHLRNPARLMSVMGWRAQKGLVATTPNGARYDVIAMDPTHVTPLDAGFFVRGGWQAEVRSHFGKPEDSVLAWWTR